MTNEQRIAALESKVKSLDETIRQMKALARGPKGEDGRDGKDGKDGRDGKVIKLQSPMGTVRSESREPVAWDFFTDASGKTRATPILP